MFDICPYTPERKDEWNRFVAQSRNGTFLFDRSYMDYHADRFTDHSLLFYRDRRLVALFPACEVGSLIYSHQGLSYGGMLIAQQTTAACVCELFSLLNDYLRRQGFSRVVCKPVPTLYHTFPSEECLYALHFVCHATLASRDLASVVSISGDERIRFAELRRRGRRKALAHGLTVAQSDDFQTFWHILEDNIGSKYGAKPVHTLDEMLLLKSRFPQNILLYAAFEDGMMTGGSVLYVTPRVVKTQYISASVRGKETGALDLLFDHLINGGVFSQPWLDMGTSALGTHDEALNPTLIHQKEGFGARGICYDTYEWEVK